MPALFAVDQPRRRHHQHAEKGLLLPRHGNQRDQGQKRQGERDRQPRIQSSQPDCAVPCGITPIHAISTFSEEISAGLNSRASSHATNCSKSLATGDWGT